jgi:hypothetical protein
VDGDETETTYPEYRHAPVARYGRVRIDRTWTRFEPTDARNGLYDLVCEIDESSEFDLMSSLILSRMSTRIAAGEVLSLYRLAQHRLRERLAATGQTVPNQLKQPTDRPTMRWMFQCFEGVSLVPFQPPHGPPQHNLAGLEPLHAQVAKLLGPHCEKLYNVDD